MKQKIIDLSIAWDMLVPLFFYMVVNDLILYGGRWIVGGIADENTVLVNAVGAVLAAVPLGIWYRDKQRKRQSLQEDQQKKQQGNQQGNLQKQRVRSVRQDAVWVVLLAAGACICFNNLLMVLDIPSAGFDRASQTLSAPPLMVQILCIGLVIPFTEELIFRGLVYTRLREEMPMWRAVLFSAVYFGVFHGNLVQGIYAVILGCLMAVIFEWYDSLTAAWLFHAVANLTSIFMARMGIQSFLLEHAVWMAVTIAAGGVLSLGSAYMIKKGKIRK